MSVSSLLFFTILVSTDGNVLLVGQWAPISGTGLALFGSLYVLLAEAMTQEAEAMDMEKKAKELEASAVDLEARPKSSAQRCSTLYHHQCGQQDSREPCQYVQCDMVNLQEDKERHAAIIRKVARMLVKLGNFSNPAQKRFDDSDFQWGKATSYPEIPGGDRRRTNRWGESRKSESSATRAEHMEGIRLTPTAGSPQRPQQRDTLQPPAVSIQAPQA